jgi:hypothetical protein
LKLKSARLGPFRSINTAQDLSIDPKVTVLVGMNEAGKTVALKALYKSRSAIGDEKFDLVEDYPRKDLASYRRRHQESPEVAVLSTYELEDSEVEEINATYRTKLPAAFRFTVGFRYDNSMSIGLRVDEAPVLASLRAEADLSSDAVASIDGAKTLREAAERLEAISRTPTDEAFLAELKKRIDASKWESVIEYEIWHEYLSKNIPKFLYFSDYDLLPGKINLKDLAARFEKKAAPNTQPAPLHPKHLAVLALLRMADVDVGDFSGEAGYEELKARIESVSINLTDQVLAFWKQNEDLEVEVDIKPDPSDEAPFNDGPNLYLRIKNRRHRGVSTPFDQRSRGFIWFFSFLVWFDSVQHQLQIAEDGSVSSLVLLLDEPGLALHALAQADFLRYIDSLAEEHQVIYTTHSPFMVNSDRLNQVRLIEDKANVGTVISENLVGSDPRTIFPLQAALGWTIAQNLFISSRNLLVEGPSELSYLQVASMLVEQAGKTGLREDVTIVPVGGMNNLVTFVSLLNANGLTLAVLHDYSGKPDQKLLELVKQKLLEQRAVFDVSQFRDLASVGSSTVPSDIEDLLPVGMYLEYFCQTFAKQLNGLSIGEDDLPPGDRIVNRIERLLAEKKISLKTAGGYNHYAVAAQFARNPPSAFDEETVSRFAALFDAVNGATGARRN